MHAFPLDPPPEPFLLRREPAQVEAAHAAEQRAWMLDLAGMALGGLLFGAWVWFGTVFPRYGCVSPCCGATVEQAERAEVRRRCLELGVTPAELAALDAGAGP